MLNNELFTVMYGKSVNTLYYIFVGYMCAYAGLASRCLVPIARQNLDGIGQEGGWRQHVQTRWKKRKFCVEDEGILSRR